MIKEGKIDTREAIAISIIVLITKVFYTNPSTVIKACGTAGWYVTLLSVAMSLLLFLLVYMLLKRFPGKDLPQIFDAVFGKVLGKFLSLIYIAYFIFGAGTNIREFVEMIKSYNLPYTPPSLIIFAFFLPVIYISFIGLECLARISYVGSWLIIGTIYLILALNYPFYRLDALFPASGYGLKNNLFIGITRISAYNEVIILTFILTSIKDIKKIKRAGIISLVIVGISIALVIFCSLLAFDFPMATEHLSNLFELSRSIYFGRFFQRIESVFLFVWVTISILNVSALFYIALSTFCKSFNVGEHKPLILPFALTTFVITLLPNSLSEVLNKATNFQRQKSSLIIYLIPMVALIVSFIFHKKGTEE